jgi:hypothetical protein
VEVSDNTPVANFAKKVEEKIGMPVTAFDLKYNDTLLRKKKDKKAIHIRDYGLVHECIVDVVILGEEQTRTHAPKDQKFSLDFCFEVGFYLLSKTFDF